ncbi:MAG: cyclopropane-fatty-acyl-phospholipid synthase [Candidatus Liptonbacteria bacterium CG11_big_fil_rev_8_21_14_0_20_35_14]|uniref:Cyclopropane-fatty-acyl-phospholipid synthase n=1 Tax=Candidatus Liptonbacteria bacterium CG11_big_fil_rev_8_21_14_0_20_35_14 TaxID=1974634 RepID=A0A2H0N7B8_9BACT|nr:MAG: cyclopropane-fatty-acyl-phospholipid synthase [Candidatus Liptonbacteria bacterium CG11_big_fil_rev_8_21_14_0_20_35_14]
MKVTNWDLYYKKPFKATVFTRSITGNYLIRLMKKWISKVRPLEIMEFGGANSCFFDLIEKKIEPDKYYVVDNNSLGLDIFRKRIRERNDVILFNSDVRDFSTDYKFDLIFSVGLIEHFNKEDRNIIIHKHFEFLKPGGMVIIFFPTPTVLYRLTRFLAEVLGIWTFYDEIPLRVNEVTLVAGKYGKVLFNKINWWIFLTQAMIVVKKNDNE